jgi:hypothetical protein
MDECLLLKKILYQKMLKTVVFQNVKPCSVMAGYQHFEEHSGSIIKFEEGAVCLSKMMVSFYQTILCTGQCA